MDPALATLGLDAATTFQLDGANRILSENGPDGSPGPRAFLAGCPAGNLVRVRADIPEAVAARIVALVAAERPWVDPATFPACLDRIVRLLESPKPHVGVGFNYALPRQATPAGQFICSDTAEGDALLATLHREGMPAHLAMAGFASVADFWSPWCVAMASRTIAAIAFAARLAPASAAIGVYTFAGFRGRGLAAAVAARWTTLPALARRTLFYGTSEANVSSQRVTARLGLERIGLGLRIT